MAQRVRLYSFWRAEYLRIFTRIHGPIEKQVSSCVVRWLDISEIAKECLVVPKLFSVSNFQ